MYYGQPGDNDTTIPTIKNVVLDTINGNYVDYLYNLVGMPVNPISNIYFTNINITNIRKSVYHTCSNITGTCDSTSVFPTCPSCLQTEACFDASNDCSTYMNFYNNALYRKLGT
uniref:Uncharacterized protein n=1 Tax=Acrobeloides nanus TaxID=290746 RepID=A0A914DKD7_9BILA